MRNSRSSPDVPAEAIEPNVPARIVLGGVIAAYVAFFIAWTLRQHYAFGTLSFDLGIFEQGTWLLSQGKTPFVTVRGLHLFGDHTSFILLLFVPFYWVFSSTSTLLIAQSVALGAAALPAFLVAREKIRHELLALFVALAYLLHPAVAYTNLENFHPDSFEVPVLFALIYFMLKRRWIPYAVCLGALLLIKEDVPLLTFALGIYVAIRYDRKIGVITSLVSLAWLSAVLFAILPAFNNVGTLYAWRVPSDQFGGIGGLLRTTLIRPWEIVGFLLGSDRPWYLLQMLGSVGFLSLLAPGFLLVAIGPILSNVLSTFWYQYHIEYHYGTLIIPILIAAGAFGIARFRSMRARSVLVGIMVASAFVATQLWGPIPFGSPISFPDPSSDHARTLRRAISLIPEDAGVSAVYYTVPHLSHREHVYEFPNPWRAGNWGDASQEGERLPFTEDVDYVLVPREMEPDLQLIAESLAAEGFESIFDSGGFVVLQRDPR